MVCDADYRGEYIVALHNDTDHAIGISEGERIAQMVVAKHEQVDFQIVETLDETERADGGFGHTGKK